MTGRARGQRLCRVVGGPEFDAVAIRLLEVVREDLLELVHPLTCGSLQPVGHLFVQHGPTLLRYPLVCRVSNQRVHEAERLLTGDVRR
jgi:hypothetical protein